MKLHIALACFCASGMMVVTQAAEQDKRSPMEALHGDTIGTLVLCRLSFELYQLNSSAEGANYRECINTAKKKADPAFKRALGAHGKKPAAVIALKAYYSTWIASIRGVEPSMNEIKISYTTRQALIDQRLEDLWAQAEMEAGL